MIWGSGQASVKIKLGTSCPTWPPPTPKFELQASATRRRLPWIWKVFPVSKIHTFDLFFLHNWRCPTCAAIRLVFPMVELSIEVIEGLREPLIGLRCWISRCTWTNQSLRSWGPKWQQKMRWLSLWFFPPRFCTVGASQNGQMSSGWFCSWFRKQSHCLLGCDRIG